jgi:hypothetical protein
MLEGKANGLSFEWSILKVNVFVSGSHFHPKAHRDRTRASPLCFFSTFEHVKSLLIMGPNNTKNSSLKCDFLIINYE